VTAAEAAGGGRRLKRIVIKVGTSTLTGGTSSGGGKL